MLVAEQSNEEFETIDLGGIDHESRDFLITCQEEGHNIVHVSFQWIQQLILNHMNEGYIPVPPPILSRAFQELLNGQTKN